MDKIQTLCKGAIVIMIWNGFSALATVYDSDGSSTNCTIHPRHAGSERRYDHAAGGNLHVDAIGQCLKNISIIGVTGQTTINDQIPKTGNSPGAFQCNLPSGTTLFRISGIKFQGTVGPVYDGSAGQITIGGSQHDTEFQN